MIDTFAVLDEGIDSCQHIIHNTIHTYTSNRELSAITAGLILIRIYIPLPRIWVLGWVLAHYLTFGEPIRTLMNINYDGSKVIPSQLNYY